MAHDTSDDLAAPLRAKKPWRPPLIIHATLELLTQKTPSPFEADSHELRNGMQIGPS